MCWPVLTLAVVAVLGCGATTQQQDLPGKIAYEASVFPYSGDFRSNYGICIYQGTTASAIYHQCSSARWSPDGAKLLYWEGVGEGAWVIEAYPERRALKRFNTPHLISRPVWVSEEILYYTGYYWKKGLKEETPKNLFRYHLDTGQEEQLTSFTEVGSGEGISSFTVSPDQQTICFAKFDRDPAKTPQDLFHGNSPFIFRLDVATGQITRLFKGDYPRFMPDGQRLICSLWEWQGVPMKTSDLFYYDLATKAFTRLTHNGPDDLERDPCPSPDGQYIVYKIDVFGAGEKGRALYVINADGTHERLLVGHDGNDYGDPDWGP